jgi:hypothetical protein
VVAFVAAIEGIGARYVSLETCPVCHVSRGSRQRFLAAASFVIPEEDARKLRKLVYDTARSKTAHEGRLHGLEEAFGAFVFPGIFADDSKSTFDLIAVRGVKTLPRNYFSVRSEATLRNPTFNGDARHSVRRRSITPRTCASRSG